MRVESRVCGALLSNEPVARPEEILGQAGLGAAGFGLPIIVPADEWGQAHENRRGPPGALQAEKRAAVPDQVEFGVAAAAAELEMPFAFPVRRGLASCHYGQIGRQESVADASGHGETALEAQFVEIIEEQAADAAGLAAVPEVEVFVARRLETGIQ